MTYVDSWDQNQPAGNWDSGLQWDTNVGPSVGDVAPYLNLITSEHNQKPKFMAMIAATLQPLADAIAVTLSMPSLFDIDNAAGDQEDIVGEWVGVTRDVKVPLQNVYFSLDSTSLGLDQGTLQGPFDPTTGLVVLPDDAYRTLLYARVASNQWDGTIPQAYEIWNTLFDNTGIGILIQDYGNMTMAMALTGPVPDATTLALFEGGYLQLKPATVQIVAFITPAIADAPYFGIGVENSAIAGLDTGTFGNTSAGT